MACPPPLPLLCGLGIFYAMRSNNPTCSRVLRVQVGPAFNTRARRRCCPSQQTTASAVTAPFLDTELAVVHFVGMNSADHLLDRFLVAARVVDSLVYILHKHPVAAVYLASEESFVSSASLPRARCMCLRGEDIPALLALARRTYMFPYQASY